MRRQNLSVIVILMAVVVAVIAMVSWRKADMAPRQSQTVRPESAPPLESIEYAVCRKTSEFDPGTIRVCLRNTTGMDLAFTKVLLDGLPVPVWGVDLTPENVRENKPEVKDDEHKSVYESAAARFSGKRILWARLSPVSIPPGGIGEFAAKLVNPLSRPMKVEFVPESGKNLSVIVRPLEPALHITAITFSGDLAKAYIYYEGVKETALKIRGMEINGNWMPVGVKTHNKEISAPKTWFSSPVVGEKQFAAVTFDKPLRQGAYLTARLVCEDGFAAEERVRVFSGFPLNVECGDPPPGFGLDEYPFACYANGSFLPVGGGKGGGLRGNYLFCCHMHEFGGNLELCASETLRRYALCREKNSEPSFNHLCRICAERGYALFAETADILRINPNIQTSMSKRDYPESPEEVVARVCKYAYFSSRPRPVHSLADTSIFDGSEATDSPEAVRRRIFTILASGVKGLFYRHREWKKAGELNEEIRKINAVIRIMIPYLTIADPIEISEVRKDSILPGALLAGDQAVIVFAIRKAAAGKGEEETASSHEFLVSLPGGLAPVSCSLLGVDKELQLPFAMKEGKILVTLPQIKQAEVCLLRLRRMQE